MYYLTYARSSTYIHSFNHSSLVRIKLSLLHRWWKWGLCLRSHNYESGRAEIWSGQQCQLQAIGCIQWTILYKSSGAHKNFCRQILPEWNCWVTNNPHLTLLGVSRSFLSLPKCLHQFTFVIDKSKLIFLLEGTHKFPRESVLFCTYSGLGTEAVPGKELPGGRPLQLSLRTHFVSPGVAHF